MAVPFRRTGKTARRKRRTHYKLTKPCLVICPENGEFSLPHRVTKNADFYYKGKKIELHNQKETTPVSEASTSKPKEKSYKKDQAVKSEKKVEKKVAPKASASKSASTKASTPKKDVPAKKVVAKKKNG